MKPTLSFLFMALGLGFATFANADTVTINADADTTIYSDNVDNNGGGHNFGIAGFSNSGNERRLLMLFDLTGIAAGSTINQVSLDIDALRVNRGGGDFRLYRVNRGWGEGNKSGNRGAAATSGEATWADARYPNLDWVNSAQGGSWFAPILDQASINSTGVATFDSSTAFVSSLQAMLDNPSENWGFLIRGIDNNVGAVRFGTREGGSAARLNVDFTRAVPEPGSMSLLLAAGVGLIFRRRR